jgi:hypothetical protein
LTPWNGYCDGKGFCAGNFRSVEAATESPRPFHFNFRRKRIQRLKRKSVIREIVANLDHRGPGVLADPSREHFEKSMGSLHLPQT